MMLYGISQLHRFTTDEIGQKKWVFLLSKSMAVTHAYTHSHTRSHIHTVRQQERAVGVLYQLDPFPLPPDPQRS